MNERMKNDYSEEAFISSIISELHENELKSIYNSIKTDEIELSEGFHERMRLLEDKMRRRDHQKSALRVAIGMAACLTIVFVLLFPGYVVNASRSALEWFQDHVVLQFFAASKEDEIIEYQLSYVPDGYVLLESNYEAKNGYCLFSNDRDEEISFYYVINDAALTLDSEEATFEEIMTDRGQVLYITKSENTGVSMVWQSQDGSTEFTVNCDIVFSDEELLKIASSVEFVGKE